MSKATIVLSGGYATYKPSMAYYEVCCDCGLTHFVIHDIYKGCIRKHVYRDEYRTKIERADIRARKARAKKE